MSRNTSPRLRENIGNLIFDKGVAYTIHKKQLKQQLENNTIKNW